MSATMFRSAVITAAVALACVGCGPKEAAVAEDPTFDLCSALTVDDVRELYGDDDLEVVVTKHLDSSYGDRAMASCHYGRPGKSSLMLSVPLGEPVIDVAELLGGSYNKDGVDFTLGDDTAYYLESPSSEAAIAVRHGDTRFAITSRPWADTEKAPAIGQDELGELATRVASRLPAELVLSDRDIPSECEDVVGDGAVVGDAVIMARGTANADTLNCDVLGPGGLVTTEAIKEPTGIIERNIGFDEEYSRDELLDPPVDDAVLVDRGSAFGFRLEGNIRDCCSMKSEHERDRGDSRYEDDITEINSEERDFVESFVRAAQAWARSQ